MGAHDKSDEDWVTKRNFGVCDFFRLGAVLADKHKNPDTVSDELYFESAWAVEWEIERIGVFALLTTPLKPGHTAAVNDHVGVGGISVERLADHNAGLAVLGSLTQEAQGSCDGEIACHLPPDILKLILFGPDIRAGASDAILPVRKLGGAFNRRMANIAGVGKQAQISVLGKSRGRE